MIALTIMALIMVGLYSTLNATMNTRDMLEREVRAARLGPQILDVIESDLKRVWAFNIDDDMVFKGERRTILGESADTLIFLTSIDSTLVHVVGDDSVTADLCETGYRLRASPELPDVLELWRRQSFHVDEDPLEDGSYERLHDRVVSLQFRYYADDDVETDPEENWDASVTHTLPTMVKVTLGIEVGPRMADSQEQRDIGTYWYERLVPLQRDVGLTMRVHPLPPTFLAAVGQGAGGPNTEQDDEDEESDREEDGPPDDGGSGNPDDIFGDLFGGGSGGGGGGNPFEGFGGDG
ncbi:MAG: hypothetical protein P8N09_07790 [Planctomycetota bacterium]|nr:hypothetical protein [Planctomycetota bacterium]